MNKFRYAAVLSIFLLFGQTLTAKLAPHRNSAGQLIRRGGNFDSRPIYIPPVVNAPRGEFRGVWVSTVLNLDFKAVKSVAEFKKQYNLIVKNIAASGCNAIIFQVRPNCDAFYPSRFAPVSQWLTGKEGVGLGSFDPLAYMINTAHAYKLEFHAWLNPYRVMNDIKTNKKAYLNSRHPANFARQNPHLVLEFNNGKTRSLFLDPGRPEVIQHMQNAVYELCSKYTPDAIHFDDYFYPYEEIGNLDNATFARYNPRKLNKAAWRRLNTETLIYNIRLVINQVNNRQRKRIKFGISPFGIWGNAKDIKGGSATGGKQTYFNLYADTRGWVKRGYLDYIAPQIYWNFAHETAAYAALVNWWSYVIRNTKTKLYIGMAPYRLGERNWGREELAYQLLYNRLHKEVSGFILFSYRHLFNSKGHPGVKAFFQAMRRSVSQDVRW